MYLLELLLHSSNGAYTHARGRKTFKSRGELRAAWAYTAKRERERGETTTYGRADSLWKKLFCGLYARARAGLALVSREGGIVDGKNVKARHYPA